MQRTNGYRAILFFSLCAMLAPLWWVRYLPLSDYPHGLARAYIAAHYWQVPSFQRLYLPPRFVPNMGFEGVAALLGPGVDTMFLGRVLLSLSIVLFVYGCHRLGRAFHGRPVWNSVVAAFFIYSASLLYGTVNTLLGVSLFLVAFAFWYECHAKRPLVVVLCSAPILVLLTLVHLSTYAFAAVSMILVLALELRQRQISVQKAAALLTPLALPGLLLVFFFEHGGTVGTIEYGRFYDKALENLSLFTTYRHAFDAFFIAGFFLFVLVTLLRRKRVDLSRPALLIGVAFYTLVWICPNRLFTSSGADIRFLLPAFVFLLLSARVELHRITGWIVLVLLLAFHLTRLGLIAFDWEGMSAGLSEQMRLIDRLPENARVYPIEVYTEGRRAKTDLGLKSGHCYGVLLRHVNDLALDAYPAQHAVVYREPTGHRYFDGEADLSQSTLDSIRGSADYLWCFRPPAFLTEKLRSVTLDKLVDSGGGVWLWKVRAR